MKTDKITGRFNSKTGFHVACMAPPPAKANGFTSILGGHLDRYSVHCAVCMDKVKHGAS